MSVIYNLSADLFKIYNFYSNDAYSLKKIFKQHELL